MGTTRLQGTFELLDPAVERASDMFGLWKVRSPPADLIFDSAGTPELPVVWRVSLPADPALASASLGEAEKALAMSEQALDEAVARLEVYAIAPAPDVAFDLAVGPATQRRPETRLNALLAEMADGEVVFDVAGAPAATWAQTSAEYRGFLRRLRQSIADYASVQTYAGDNRIGWTVVGWSGDVDTVWRAGLSAEQADLHRRALDLALASRANMLRMFVLAVRGAAILAGAVATPLGPILAVPAAWSFVNDVLAELHR